jgi:hypothetical protein
VLSKEFVTREWPMKELMWFLERVRKGEPVSLLPVFLGLTYEECWDLGKRYADDDFWAGIPQSDRDEVAGKHEEYAGAIKDLLQFTAVHAKSVSLCRRCLLVLERMTDASSASAVRRLPRRHGGGHTRRDHREAAGAQAAPTWVPAAWHCRLADEPAEAGVQARHHRAR